MPLPRRPIQLLGCVAVILRWIVLFVIHWFCQIIGQNKVFTEFCKLIMLTKLQEKPNWDLEVREIDSINGFLKRGQSPEIQGGHNRGHFCMEVCWMSS